MANSKIEINAESVGKILNDALERIIEERNLALDRFKRQDENIDSNEQFIFQGKILAEYLRAASDRTDASINIAKLIAGIVYEKGDGVKNSNGNMSDDDMKKEIQRQLTETNLLDDTK